MVIRQPTRMKVIRQVNCLQESQIIFTLKLEFPKIIRL